MQFLTKETENPWFRVKTPDVGLGPFLSAHMRQSLRFAPVSGMARMTELSLAQAGEKISVDEANERWGIPEELEFDEPISDLGAQIMYERKKRELQDEYEIASGYTGLGRMSAGFVTQLVGQALDPINLASMFIPVVSQAKTARWAAQLGSVWKARALTGVIEGAVGAALVEPLVILPAMQEKSHYGMKDAAINLGFGAILGGAFHVGVGKLGDKLTEFRLTQSADRNQALARMFQVEYEMESRALRGGMMDSQQIALAQSALNDILQDQPVMNPAKMMQVIEELNPHQRNIRNAGMVWERHQPRIERLSDLDVDTRTAMHATIADVTLDYEGAKFKAVGDDIIYDPVGRYEGEEANHVLSAFEEGFKPEMDVLVIRDGDTLIAAISYKETDDMIQAFTLGSIGKRGEGTALGFELLHRARERGKRINWSSSDPSIQYYRRIFEPAKGETEFALEPDAIGRLLDEQKQLVEQLKLRRERARVQNKRTTVDEPHLYEEPKNLEEVRSRATDIEAEIKEVEVDLDPSRAEGAPEVEAPAPEVEAPTRLDIKEGRRVPPEEAYYLDQPEVKESIASLDKVEGIEELRSALRGRELYHVTAVAEEKIFAEGLNNKLNYFTLDEPVWDLGEVEIAIYADDVMDRIFIDPEGVHERVMDFEDIMNDPKTMSETLRVAKEQFGQITGADNIVVIGEIPPEKIIASGVYGQEPRVRGAPAPRAEPVARAEVVKIPEPKITELRAKVPKDILDVTSEFGVDIVSLWQAADPVLGEPWYHGRSSLVDFEQGRIAWFTRDKPYANTMMRVHSDLEVHITDTTTGKTYNSLSEFPDEVLTDYLSRFYPERFVEERIGGELDTILTTRINVQNPADVGQFLTIIKEYDPTLRVEIDEFGQSIAHMSDKASKQIFKESGYHGRNILDMIYIPEVKERLKAAGFDSVIMGDPSSGLGVYADTLVVFDPNKVEVVDQLTGGLKPEPPAPRAEAAEPPDIRESLAPDERITYDELTVDTRDVDARNRAIEAANDCITRHI